MGAKLARDDGVSVDVYGLLHRYREQALLLQAPRVVFSDYASGILRNPTARRFQPLMALIATVRSTISLGLKCSLSRA